VLLDATVTDQLRAAERTAHTLGLKLHPVELRNLPHDYATAFKTLSSAHPEALLVTLTGRFFRDRILIADQAKKYRMPAIYGVREMVEAGGLLSYGANLTDLFARAATYVDKILKGAKPGDLPVEQPTTFELVVNMKTAKALGLKIPNSILVQATKVIE
jgi:putative ABC transport system substrate-binding protein